MERDNDLNEEELNRKYKVHLSEHALCGKYHPIVVEGDIEDDGGHEEQIQIPVAQIRRQRPAPPGDAPAVQARHTAPTFLFASVAPARKRR